MNKQSYAMEDFLDHSYGTVRFLPCFLAPEFDLTVWLCFRCLRLK